MNIPELNAAMNRCGWGITGERRRMDLLATHAPHLTENQRWDVVDGVAELYATKGQIHSRPVTLKFDLTITSDNGWLSPEGKFYGCKFHEHSDTAYKIMKGKDSNPERTLEEKGWIKVQRRYEGDCQWFFRQYRDFETESLPVTKRQKRAITDYCVANKLMEFLPHWIDD